MGKEVNEERREKLDKLCRMHSTTSAPVPRRTKSLVFALGRTARFLPKHFPRLPNPVRPRLLPPPHRHVAPGSADASQECVSAVAE